MVEIKGKRSRRIVMGGDGVNDGDLRKKRNEELC